jgi:hypothetical protein
MRMDNKPSEDCTGYVEPFIFPDPFEPQPNLLSSISSLNWDSFAVG